MLFSLLLAVMGGPAAHLACGSFKYFWKSLSECKVSVFQSHPEGGLQALDCNCKKHRHFLLNVPEFMTEDQEVGLVLRFQVGWQRPWGTLCSVYSLTLVWILPGQPKALGKSGQTDMPLSPESKEMWGKLLSLPSGALHGVPLRAILLGSCGAEASLERSPFRDPDAGDFC